MGVSSHDPPPEFFIDRSLGKSIAEGLRACGLVVSHTMADAYGERPAQLLPDEIWLRDAGAHGWVVLTKERIIRQAREPGPYIYGVYEGRISRIWPPHDERTQ